MSYQRLTRDQHLHGSGPKRILALNGGGLRGIVTLTYLRRVELLLRERHGGDPAFRLCDYFDLIAGTSTGAIIAAGLAVGLSVEELMAEYRCLGRKVFKRSWSRVGVFRAKYDDQALVQELRRVFGDRALGDASLRTGLLIVTKRLDTGSPWPLSNNPRGRYFRAEVADSWVSNADFPLWQVVRASTAAPTYFRPERIRIATQIGKDSELGVFLDGGVSPHNNPALQALMYAVLDGYGLRWRTGRDRILLLSVGTGRGDASRDHGRIAALDAVEALQSVIDDCADLNEALLQWLADAANPRAIDLELGAQNKDSLAEPLAHYIRYQLALDPESLRRLDPAIPEERLKRLSLMDDPENLEPLFELASCTLDQIDDAHFPAAFDLPKPILESGLARYRRCAQTDVVAIPLRLVAPDDAAPTLFRYRKWGAEQRAKVGDWLVQNGEDVYTIDADTFAATYTRVAPGRFRKVGTVWAERATQSGLIRTKEGETRYKPGDWLVYNRAGRQDGYAMGADRFAELYEPEE